MTRIFVAALGLLAFTACGGKSGTLTLKIVVSPGDDPFSDAAQVRFTVGDSAHVTTVPVSMGRFNFKISGKPQNKGAQILVEALDAAGNVVAHGTTPQILLQPVDQGPYAVWVGRPGRVAAAPAALGVLVTQPDGSTVAQPLPRAEMASTAITGLGVLYAGGRDTNGTPLLSTAVYDVYTHDIIATANLPKALAGAVAAPVSGVHAVVFGGATMGGFGTPDAPESSLTLFDPTVGIGVWAPLPADPIAARAYANGTSLSSGSFLVSGGIDGNGAPQASAGLVNPDGTVKLTQLASPMAAARVFHAVAPAKFPDGDGAILFGGLAGASGPVAERLVGQSFSAYDVGAQDNRLNATASTMPSGDVLVLGGKTTAGAQPSGLVISPTTPSATVTPLPAALSVAREGHSATLVGKELVVCGGADATGALQASCDVLDATSYARKTTVPMATARRGHSAQLLETGIVILAGGFGSDGKPLASIEIYTP